MTLGTVSDGIAIVGVAIGILGIIAAVWAARKWGSRRGRLAIEIESSPLIPAPSEGALRPDLLKVTYLDIEVDDPHLVTIRLANVGSADIASVDFDGGRPIVVNLGSKMYGPTASTYPGRLTTPAIGDEGWIQFQPTLLPKNGEWRVEAVVGGVPSPTWRSHLVNADTVPGQSQTSEIAGRVASRVLSDILRAALRA